jgi:hypothetical protein
MAEAVFFSGDLMFGSRVAGAAASSGCQLHTVGNLKQLAKVLDAMTEDDTARGLLLVDLESPQANAQAIADSASSCAIEVTVVGYAGHVKTALLQSARDAGFQQVLSKGQFNEQMRDLLAGA